MGDTLSKFKTTYQIIKKDFNRYRIEKSEIEAVLPALQDTFKTLWEKEFPEQPWKNDKASVELFEENVKNACKKRTTSRKNSQKEEQKINKMLADLNKDETWYKCEWDISALSKVLVDCRLFNLEGISVELSDHIKGITDIRNKMAHATAFGVEEQEFKDTMKSLKTHLEGLSCVISVHHYLHTLEQLESDDMPTSTDQLKDMCHEIEIMKVTLKWCQEKEQRLLDSQVLEKEKHELKAKLLNQMHENTSEINDLKKEISQLKKDKANLEKTLTENNTEIKQTIDGIAKDVKNILHSQIIPKHKNEILEWACFVSQTTVSDTHLKSFPVGNERRRMSSLQSTITMRLVNKTSSKMMNRR